jgi:dipeptidyl-peptidase III
MISQFLEEMSIFPENTRIRKATSTPTPIFEVLQASIEKDTQIHEFLLPGSTGLVRLVRGDHSEELGLICSALSNASKNAANNVQKLFISRYIDSFKTGSLDVYRDSQRTWIKDKSPRVENIFGFVEPYRDPSGIRAEFEGLVAITDSEETKLLLKLVEHSTRFIRLLPWADTGSTENEGKGPFEKALFQPPDFTSLHGMWTSCNVTSL